MTGVDVVCVVVVIVVVVGIIVVVVVVVIVVGIIVVVVVIIVWVPIKKKRKKAFKSSSRCCQMPPLKDGHNDRIKTSWSSLFLNGGGSTRRAVWLEAGRWAAGRMPAGSGQACSLRNSRESLPNFLRQIYWNIGKGKNKQSSSCWSQSFKAQQNL